MDTAESVFNEMKCSHYIWHHSLLKTDFAAYAKPSGQQWWRLARWRKARRGKGRGKEKLSMYGENCCGNAVNNRHHCILFAFSLVSAGFHPLSFCCAHIHGVLMEANFEQSCSHLHVFISAVRQWHKIETVKEAAYYDNTLITSYHWDVTGVCDEWRLTRT